MLLIEDSEIDAEFLVLELERGGYTVAHERVETVDALVAALEQRRWDVIVADYSLPAMEAPQALAIVRERLPDVPFIMVSGTVDEVTAVAAMRAGANDFIAKASLARFLPAVEREICEAVGRADRRQMQAQMMVSDRMASLGTLAAGLAHEINNPLAAVLANTEVVLHDLEAALDDYRAELQAPRADGAARAAVRFVARAEAWLEPLRDVCDATQQVCKVSRDLKLFSRGREDTRVAVDVRGVLDASLRIAGNETRHRARVVRDYDEVPPVAANETRLGQLFLNLIVNAAHAIPEGAASRHEIRVVVKLGAAGWVVVEVHDSGEGIPDDVLPRIFDPFYTTKSVELGTGLGLAICHRLVAELGGTIEVETRVGVGTTFRVVLPVANGLAIVPAPVAARAQQSVRRGRILIVDDDELVLRAAQRALSPAHDVTVTTNSRGALEGMQRGDAFDLVLCDVMMPNLTGIDLYEALRSAVPDQAARIVFMTGGAFTTAAREFLATVRQPQLEKPFDATTLKALVAKLLC